jgi:anti-anti-sigma factor
LSEPVSADPGAVAIVTLSGELDYARIDEIRRLGCAPLIGGDVRVIAIDLRDVTFLDSSALGALIHVRNTARADGVDVRLRHVSTRLRALFRMTALDGVFAID